MIWAAVAGNVILLVFTSSVLAEDRIEQPLMVGGIIMSAILLFNIAALLAA